ADSAWLQEREKKRGCAALAGDGEFELTRLEAIRELGERADAAREEGRLQWLAGVGLEGFGGLAQRHFCLERLRERHHDPPSVDERIVDLLANFVNRSACVTPCRGARSWNAHNEVYINHIIYFVREGAPRRPGTSTSWASRNSGAKHAPASGS